MGGCLAPSRSSNKLLPTTPNKQNGNNRPSLPKSKKTVISPVSNESSCSPTTMDEKNNNLTSKIQSRSSTDFNRTTKKEYPIGKNSDGSSREAFRSLLVVVTVYLNYLGDNSGMFLNPQKFRSMMPSMFGPGEADQVLATILDSCIKCAFHQSVSREILNAFPRPDAERQDSFTPIKCMTEEFFRFD